MLASKLPSSNSRKWSPDTRMIPSGFLLPFVLVTALFALWGIVHNLNDILIRQFMKSFAITRLQAGLVQFGVLHGLLSLGHARRAADATLGI